MAAQASQYTADVVRFTVLVGTELTPRTCGEAVFYGSTGSRQQGRGTGAGDAAPGRKPGGMYDSGRRFCARKASPAFDQRSDQRLAQFPEEHPPPVAQRGHPLGFELPPYHERVVRGHVKNVVEDDQGPARCHSPAAVGGDEFVQVVHAAFVGVVVQHEQGLAVRAPAEDVRGPRVERAVQQTRSCFSWPSRTPARCRA